MYKRQKYHERHRRYHHQQSTREDVIMIILEIIITKSIEATIKEYLLLPGNVVGSRCCKSKSLFSSPYKLWLVGSDIRSPRLFIAKLSTALNFQSRPIRKRLKLHTWEINQHVPKSTLLSLMLRKFIARTVSHIPQWWHGK